MERPTNEELGQAFGEMFFNRVWISHQEPEKLAAHILEVIAKLAASTFKSADSGEDRGDFAKGREQMAMHAIALLAGAKDWKHVERILFGDGNGD